MLKNYFPHVPIQSISIFYLNIETMNQGNQAPKAVPETKSKKSETKIQSSDKLYYQDDDQITLGEKMKLADAFKKFTP